MSFKIFRYAVVAFWIVVLCLAGYVAAENETDPSQVLGDKTITEKSNPEPREDIYALGEKTTYNVTWNGKLVGQGITVVDRVIEKGERKAYLVKTFTRANDFINMIYPVNDRVESHVDLESLAPVYFMKSLREGTFERDEYIDIDTETQIASFFRKKNEEYQLKAKLYVPRLVQDPLSVMFYLRGLEFEVGKTLSVQVVDAKETHAMAVKVECEEEVVIRNVGTYQCYKLVPTAAFEGLFKRKDADVEMWIDKETNLPVKATASVPFGDIVFSLDSVVNVFEEQEKEKAPADRWWKNKK